MNEGLNDAFRNTARLKVAAFLSGCTEAQFQAIERSCSLSKSSLSKHVAALEDRGYVSVRKGYVGKQPRTWIRLTNLGNNALQQHVTALRNIADRAAEQGRHPDSTSHRAEAAEP